ncbi:hypothetical protein [Nocardioides sp. 616]|uniref:hypothetical protein n=1 Tax=Nocardioides sp. 616 TaxID=2268090 RepID=UPI000CE3A3B5|nr:hypothetical protein [Nocardioides sp. 616]
MLDLFDANLVSHVIDVVRLVDDPQPEDTEVKAGWTALIVWLLMALAVALLAWSLIRQLRRTNANRDAGVFGDEPVSRSKDDQQREDERPEGQ